MKRCAAQPAAAASNTDFNRMAGSTAGRGDVYKRQSNGFVAGGPWVKPCDAMKRLESVETVVTGGMPLTLKLQTPNNKYNFYRDIRVIAIPTKDVPEICMKLSANTSQFAPELLFGGQELYSIPAMKDAPIYINIDYTEVTSLRSISLSLIHI